MKMQDVTDVTLCHQGPCDPALVLSGNINPKLIPEHNMTPFIISPHSSGTTLSATVSDLVLMVATHVMMTLQSS